MFYPLPIHSFPSSTNGNDLPSTQIADLRSATRNAITAGSEFLRQYGFPLVVAPL